MEEIFDRDFISEILDEVFDSPCDNCKDRTKCDFDNEYQCRDNRLNLVLKAERIA